MDIYFLVILFDFWSICVVHGDISIYARCPKDTSLPIIFVLTSIVVFPLRNRFFHHPEYRHQSGFMRLAQPG